MECFAKGNSFLSQRRFETSSFNFRNMGKKILLRNRIRCKKCGDIIESKTNYDHQFCKCGAVSIDGGLVYTRVVGDPKDYEMLDLWMTVS